MPELPEVETARKLIADAALHRRIVAVDDTDTFVCRPHAPGELRAALTGRTLIAAHRRGKTMWCETSGLEGPDSGEKGPDLGIHLGMGGRIVVTASDGDAAVGGDPFRRDAQPRKAEWDRFTLMFADGGSLALFDKRWLGRIRLNPDIDALGPDAEEVSRAEFDRLITKGSIAVKARLLDQSKIAGVGNLLADEILWQAFRALVSFCARVSGFAGALVFAFSWVVPSTSCLPLLVEPFAVTLAGDSNGVCSGLSSSFGLQVWASSQNGFDAAGGRTQLRAPSRPQIDAS